ncbi:MAG: alpha/beta hydrolase [Comamonadaceae bacterium]|nr:alpha/beta hydrolase [Rubrivivax sp.]NLZ42498.1 alpha/beta hydrolase [Comamonadaceae bacterium]
MPTPPPRLPLSLSDLRGLSRLGFDATLGITGVVEQMHRTIGERAAPLGAPVAGRTGGLTGAVYAAVRGTTRLAGKGTDTLLRLLEPLGSAAPESLERAAVLAAINGIWGDHLEASANPLAIAMSLRVQGRALELNAPQLQAALPGAGRRVAVLVHGLAMNDLQWLRQGHDHGALLANELGCTVLYLRYNSGAHVSVNGERLAALLEALAANWPLTLDELVLVGHSMGGLVARSACHVAEAQGLAWRAKLGALVCLGTPHHGALLERGGHRLDRLLDVSPYVAPFARLGKARSAGITDLRYGNVQRADWEGRSAHDQKRDDRRPTPLPAGVPVHLLAATTSASPAGLRHALVGDGLVTLASAWGEHRDPALALQVPAAHKELITQANHWDLLSRPEAADALRRWLA